MSDVDGWLVRAIPRAAVFVTAVAEVLSGDVLYGAFCFAALLLTIVPAIHARRLDAGIPLELELALLWLLVTDMTLGNWLGLYRLVWFDKALHLTSSVLIALVGFLAVYVVHLTHHTRFRPWLDAITILLVTLGIGALWEIAEYVVDLLLARRTQGAPGLSPIDDTMFDLILDGVGGVVGAVFGPLYISRSRRSRRVVEAFASFVAGRNTRAREGPRNSRGPRRVRCNECARAMPSCVTKLGTLDAAIRAANQGARHARARSDEQSRDHLPRQRFARRRGQEDVGRRYRRSARRERRR